MSAIAFSHRRLSEHIGCEVELNLNEPLSTEERAQVKLLYARHHLLLFRGQQLSMERQADVADYFSPVLRTGDGLTYISNVRADGQLGDNELAFHSDLAYAEYPYLGLSLHAID